jgi:hypothetical protein
MDGLPGAFELTQETGLAIPQVLNHGFLLHPVESKHILGADFDTVLAAVAASNVYSLNTHRYSYSCCRSQTDRVLKKSLFAAQHIFSTRLRLASLQIQNSPFGLGH